MRGRTLALPLWAFAAACASGSLIPPTPPPTGVATFVSAPFDLTWTAALDHLATVGVPTASVDRRAGVIRTGDASVDPTFAVEYADCGSRSRDGGEGVDADPFRAASARYELEVTRDGSSASSVLITAIWSGDGGSPFPCETTRVWENEAQEAIRIAAEVNR